METPPVGGPGPSTGTAVVAIALAVAVLYFGREILVPFALAILLGFALAPVVNGLRRWRIPRVPAVLAVVLVAFLAIFAFGAVVASQLTSLAEDLPRYQRNIEEKIHALRGSAPGGGIVERASAVLKDLSQEVAKPQETEAPETPAGEALNPEPRPVPVEIRQPDPAPLEVVQRIVGPLVEPLATGGVVIVFVIFILLQRENLRDRLIRLAGPRDLQRTTEALDDAGHRVSRYLLMQLVVNVTYGVPVGLGLWVIGVPNPLLWGMVAIVLRFIPYVGPVIAAAFPLALAIAVDPGWSVLLWTAALFIVLELISNNFVEPWLYGSSTGISSVAIVFSAIFWTWLWGPVGLLLSTPLTVCLVVLGRHIPQLQFLDVLLGNEAVLAPEESFYQRMLAGDPDEATEQAESFLTDRPLAAYYDEVALRGLALAIYDQQRGVLDEARLLRLRETAMAVIDNLSDAGAAAPAGAPRVACIAGRGHLDETAAMMLADLLRRDGIDAFVLPCEAVSAANLQRLDLSGTAVACLSYISPNGFAHARYACRRLRRRAPGVKIVIGAWLLSADETARRDPAAGSEADLAATSLSQAVDVIRSFLPAPAGIRPAAE